MVDILDFPENHVSSSLEKTVKPLEVPKSDHAGRPRFHDGIDAFSTPRRPSKHRRRGLSGTPRPPLTHLRPTCVAGRVVSFPA